MTSCSNLSRSSTALTVFWWCIGLGFAAFLGFVTLTITLVTVIAAIGSQANKESQSKAMAAPITQVSQSNDESF